MKVFVSWSGKLSQQVAEELKKWLQQCIQSLEVFYSDQDIEKGDVWGTKVSEELRDTNFGIVCLTQENISAPWIHFEAGALSKMLDSKVATLTINVNFADIKGPLSSFQGTKLEKDEMYKLLKSINASLEKPLTENVLKNSFDAFWNNFYESVSNIINNYDDGEDKKNLKINVPEVVEEILQIVKRQSLMISKLYDKNFEDWLVRDFEQRKTFNDNIDYLFERIFDFTEYIFNNLYSFDNIRDVSFVVEYTNFIEKLVYDYPIWRRRFKHLIYKIKISLEKESLSSNNRLKI